MKIDVSCLCDKLIAKDSDLDALIAKYPVFTFERRKNYDEGYLRCDSEFIEIVSPEEVFNFLYMVSLLSAYIYTELIK